jgi:hypothetical protein
VHVSGSPYGDRCVEPSGKLRAHFAAPNEFKELEKVEVSLHSPFFEEAAMFQWIKDITNKNARSRPNRYHRQRRPSQGSNFIRPRLEMLEDRLARLLPELVKPQLPGNR